MPLNRLSWTAFAAYWYDTRRFADVYFRRESLLPNIKAAEKWAQQSEKRTERNKSVKSRLRTLYKAAATAGQPEVTRSVEGAFDKAAAKGIIHPNKAARKKSRLAKATQRNAVTPATTQKTKSSRIKK